MDGLSPRRRYKTDKCYVLLDLKAKCLRSVCFCILNFLTLLARIGQVATADEQKI